MTLFKLSGFISVVLGVISCAVLINPFLLFYSLLSAIIGFIFSTINVFHKTKYEYKEFALGYVGMLLCSGPVIFIIVLILRG